MLLPCHHPIIFSQFDIINLPEGKKVVARVYSRNSH